MSGERRDLGAPGLYHLVRLESDPPLRFHLRVDPDGGGLLLANASEAAHLSPVGVLMVHAALEGMGDTQIIEQVRVRFRGGSVAQVTKDLEAVRKLLADLATPDDNFPITNFGAGDPSQVRRLRAPFQAYVTQGAPGQVEPILRALWEAGVPQATFLARPDADSAGLVRLVECAGDIGMITGLRTAAGWLPEDSLRAAAMAGLDFVTLVLASADPDEHDSVLGPGDHAAFVGAAKACHELELCPVAQVPLTDGSVDELHAIVELAAGQGVRNFTFFAIACLDGQEAEDAAGALPARALPQVATLITECAEEAGARFLWAPPVRLDLKRTLAEHVIAGPRAGGEVSIRVEADGTVYAPRGPRHSCGNLLKQPWDAIWRHEAFARYREGVESARRCSVCPGLEICAAGCPKDPSGWSDDTEDGVTR